MHLEYPEQLLNTVEQVSVKRDQFERLSLHEVSRASLEHKLRVELTHGSTAIEGNTLTLRETQLLLDEGITPQGGKALRELHEVRNHNEAVLQIEAWVRDGKAISIEKICELHRLVLRDIEDSTAGRFRTGRVMVTGAPLQPIKPEAIREAMADLMVTIESADESPVITATKAHYQFVKIHPYFDGNGRTGRLLMNWILLGAGYPLSVITAEQRSRYITSIDEADRGHPADFCLLIAECVESSLNQFLDLA